MTAVPDKRIPDFQGSTAGPSPVRDLWSRPEGLQRKESVLQQQRIAGVSEGFCAPAPAAAWAR